MAYGRTGRTGVPDTGWVLRFCVALRQAGERQRLSGTFAGVPPGGRSLAALPNRGPQLLSALPLCHSNPRQPRKELRKRGAPGLVSWCRDVSWWFTAQPLREQPASRQKAGPADQGSFGPPLRCAGWPWRWRRWPALCRLRKAPPGPGACECPASARIRPCEDRQDAVWALQEGSLLRQSLPGKNPLKAQRLKGPRPDGGLRGRHSTGKCTKLSADQRSRGATVSARGFRVPRRLRQLRSRAPLRSAPPLRCFVLRRPSTEASNLELCHGGSSAPLCGEGFRSWLRTEMEERKREGERRRDGGPLGTGGPLSSHCRISRSSRRESRRVSSMSIL